MLSVDNRAGSSQLAPLLRQRGYPVELTQMPFGDVAFTGIGADGVPVGVGVEAKSLNDIISCLKSSRFSGHQLPGLLQSYDHVWLLLIGVWRPRSDGTMEYQVERGKSAGYWRPIEIGRRRFMWRDLEAFLLTLQMKGGVRLMRVDDYPTAAMFLGTLYAWWQKGWDEHRSHLAIHDSMHDQIYDRALLTRPTLARCIGAQLPGIGKEKSAAVAAKFKTVKAMVDAEEKEWTSIPGVGKVLAHRVFTALRGGSNGSGRP